MIFHQILTRRVVAFLSLTLTAVVVKADPTYPGWWNAEATKIWKTSAAESENWAPVNAGQLKNVAAKAKLYLDEKLQKVGGAGGEVNFVCRFPNSGNYAPVNVGQLKNVASAFHNVLIRIGYSSAYPWTGTNIQQENSGPANIGQLKKLFSFDIDDYVGADSDSDQLPDWWERYYFGNLVQTKNGNPDLDTLSNFEEYTKGTSPASRDTDGDGREDGVESPGTSPVPDTPGPPTNPLQQDTDGDGLPDGWERKYDYDPNVADPVGDADEDGLSDLEEFALATDPQNPDTDGDGLKDSIDDDPRVSFGDGDDRDGDHLPSHFEVAVAKAAKEKIATLVGSGQTPSAGLLALAELNPLNGLDTDGDGVPDDWERVWGYNPLVAEDHANLDTDGDLLSNLNEFAALTWPKQKSATALPQIESLLPLFVIPAPLTVSVKPLAYISLTGIPFAHAVAPDSKDSDSDWLPDGYEVLVGRNPRISDFTSQELSAMTSDPQNPGTQIPQVVASLGPLDTLRSDTRLPWLSRPDYLNVYSARSGLFHPDRLQHSDDLDYNPSAAAETVYVKNWENNYRTVAYENSWPGDYFYYSAHSTFDYELIGNLPPPPKTREIWNIIRPAGRNVPKHPALYHYRVEAFTRYGFAAGVFRRDILKPFSVGYGKRLPIYLSDLMRDIPSDGVLQDAGWQLNQDGHRIGSIDGLRTAAHVMISCASPGFNGEVNGQWTAWDGQTREDERFPTSWTIGLSIGPYGPLGHDGHLVAREVKLHWSGNIRVWYHPPAVPPNSPPPPVEIMNGEDVVDYLPTLEVKAEADSAGGMIWFERKYTPLEQTFTGGTLTEEESRAWDSAFWSQQESKISCRPLKLVRGVNNSQGRGPRYTLELSETSGDEHRRIALNGLPLADSKPDGVSSLDELSGGTFIDALNLGLRHSVKDVAVPVADSSLALEVSRTYSEEIFTNRPTAPRPFVTETYGDLGKPFGACWQTNLTPYVRIDFDSDTSRKNPDYATVVDETGNSHRFAVINTGTSLSFIPVSTPGDAKSMANSLTPVSNAPLLNGAVPQNWPELTFRRHTGVTVRYKMIGRIANKPNGNPNSDPSTWTYTYVFRVLSEGGTLWGVRDQAGACLYYKYPTPDPGAPGVTAEGEISSLLIPEWISDIAGTDPSRRLRISTFSGNGTDYPTGLGDGFQSRLVREVALMQGTEILRRTRYSYVAANTSNMLHFLREKAPGKVEQGGYELEEIPDPSPVFEEDDALLPGNEGKRVKMAVLWRVLQDITAPDGADSFRQAVSYGYEGKKEIDHDPNARIGGVAYFAHFWLREIGMADSTYRFDTIFNRAISTYTGYADTSRPEYLSKQGLSRVVTAVTHIDTNQKATILSEFKAQETGTGPEGAVLIQNKLDAGYKSPASVGGKRVNMVVDADRRVRYYTFENPNITDSEFFNSLLFSRLPSSESLNRQAILTWTTMTIDYLDGAQEIYTFKPDAMMALSEATTKLPGDITRTIRWEFRDKFRASHFCPLISGVKYPANGTPGGPLVSLELHPFFPQFYPEPTAKIEIVKGTDELDIVPGAEEGGGRKFVTKYRYWSTRHGPEPTASSFPAEATPDDAVKPWGRVRVKTTAPDGTVNETTLQGAGADGEGLPISTKIFAAGASQPIKETSFLYARGILADDDPLMADNPTFVVGDEEGITGRPWRLYRTTIKNGVQTIDRPLDHKTALWRDTYGNVIMTASGAGEAADSSDDCDTDITYAQYNAAGDKIAEADGRAGTGLSTAPALALGSSPYSTLYTYRRDGRLIRQYSPEVSVTQSAYPSDQAGRAMTQINYDGMGRKSWTVDALGTRTYYRYDPLGRIDRILVDLDASGGESSADAVTNYLYTASGILAQQQSPGGPVQRHRVDWLRRPVSSLSLPEGGLITPTVEVRYSYAGGYCGDSLFSTSSFKPTLQEGPGMLSSGLAQKWFIYDSLGRLKQEKAQILHDNYAVTRTGYDIAGNVRLKKDPREKIPSVFTFDCLGRQVSEVRSSDNGGILDDITVASTYSPTGHLWKRVEEVKTPGQLAVDKRATYSFQDPVGRVRFSFLSKVTGAAGEQETAPTVDGEANLRNFYDRAGQVIRSRTLQSSGSPNVYLDTLMEYDPMGRVCKVTAPAFSDDEASPAVSKNPVTRTYYDLLGKVTKVVDPRGKEAETRYDRAGRPVQTVSAAVEIFNGTVLEGGESKLEKPAPPSNLRMVTLTAYDVGGRILRTISGQTMNAGVVTTVDQNALVTSPGTAISIVTNVYDGLGRLRSTSTRLGEGDLATDSFLYDAAGNRVSVSDAMGNVVTMNYDGLNRLLNTVHAGNDTLANRTTTNVYDDMLLTDTLRPGGANIHYTYDDLSRLTQTVFTGAASENTTRVYNSAGDLLSVAYPSAPASQPGLLRDVTYAVDRRGRVTTETSTGITHTYTYDQAGNRLSAVYGKGGVSLICTYDSHNRLSTIAEFTQDNPTIYPRYTTYHYSVGGQLVRKLHGDYRVERHTLDALGRVARTEIYNSANVLLSDYSTQRDSRGNTVWISESRMTSSAERRIRNFYDLLNRITEERELTWDRRKSTQWTYDKAGNRVATAFMDAAQPAVAALTPQTSPPVPDSSWPVIWTETLTYGLNDPGSLGADGAFTTAAGAPLTVYYSTNQLRRVVRKNFSTNAVISNTHYRYDLRGNRAEQYRSVGSPVQWITYTWDAADRLGSAVLETTSTTSSWTYGYDYRTRRVLRTAPEGSEVITFSGGTSVSQWPGVSGAGWASKLPQLASGDAVFDASVQYVRGSDYGGGVGGILYTTSPVGTRDFFEYGTRGDVVAMRSASGVPTYRAAYSAFGSHTSDGDPGIRRQRASTKEEETALGLLNEGFRYRDIETGTFISRDPAGFVDGPNLYSYVRQNPWSKFDPLGLWEGSETKHVQRTYIQDGVPMMEYHDTKHWTDHWTGNRQTWSEPATSWQRGQFFKQADGGWQTQSGDELRANYGKNLASGVARDVGGRAKAQAIAVGGGALIGGAGAVMGPAALLKEAGSEAFEQVTGVPTGVKDLLESGVKRLAAKTGGGGTTRLFRAVEGDELADVMRYGDYNIHPNSTFKRFAFDEGSLDDFIKANPGRDYTKTFIDVPTKNLDQMYRHADPGGVGKSIGIDVYENPTFYNWFDKVNILGK